LVVYHDYATPSDAFLHQRTNDEHLVILKRLHQALCDLSYEKPLKRPPLLLSGGLKAWTDLFGTSSLVLGDSHFGSPPSRPSAVGLGIISMSHATTPIPNKVGERNNKGSDHKTDEKVGPLETSLEEEAWLRKLQNEREPLAISVPKDSGTMDVKRQRRSTSIVRVPATESFPRNVEQFVCAPTYLAYEFLCFMIADGHLVSTVPGVVAKCTAVNDDPHTGDSRSFDASNAHVCIKEIYHY